MIARRLPGDRAPVPGPGVASGALAGLAATVAMSGVMLAAGRAGLMGEQPPRRIVVAALGRARATPRRERSVEALTTCAHLAFGAATGALFGVAAARAPRGALVPAAIATGLGVWALSYAGWIPGIGLLPPPWRDRPGRAGTMLAAHLVYGATLGGLLRGVGR